MVTRFPFLHPFVRRPIVVLLPIVLTCGAGVAYIKNVEQQFRSSAQLLVVQKGATLTDSRDAAMESSIKSEIIGTHLQILSSPRVIRSAIERQRLLELPSLIAQSRKPGGLRGIMMTAAVDGEVEPEDMGRAVRYIRQNIGVRRGGSDAARDAQVVEVTFKHGGSSEDCATILKAIVESYRTFLRDMANRIGEETEAAILAASQKMRDTIVEEESTRESFLNDSPLIWHNGTTVNQYQQQVANLEAGQSTLEIRRASLESRLNNIKASLDDGKSGALQVYSWIDQADLEHLTRMMDAGRQGLPVSLSTEFGRLVELKVELARKSSIYTEDHASVEQLKHAIEELKNFLESNTGTLGSLGDDEGVMPKQVVDTYTLLLKQEIAEIDSQIEATSKLVTDTRQKAKDLSRFEIEYDRINRQLERSREMYESLQERLRHLDITRNTGGFLTEEIKPVEPGLLSWPNSKFVFALCAMLGVCSGGGGALLLEFIDQSFRDKLDIEESLGLPVIATVPVKAFRRKSSGIDPSVETHHLPETDFSNAFRRLRTALVYRTREHASPAVQIISPQSGDGKSMVAANLAVSAARSGKRVLLIDADFRNPTQHQLFGISNDVGLTSITAGESLEAVTIPCETNNLDIVPTGPHTSACEELFEHVFSEFLQAVRGKYDLVLVDSPPVSDASVSLAIADVVDSSVLVLRLSGSSRSSASLVTHDLLSYGANLVGVVVNGTLESPTRYRADLKVVRGPENQTQSVSMDRVAS